LTTNLALLTRSGAAIAVSTGLVATSGLSAQAIGAPAKVSARTAPNASPMTSTGFVNAPLSAPAQLAGRRTLTAPATATVTFDVSSFAANPVPVQRVQAPAAAPSAPAKPVAKPVTKTKTKAKAKAKAPAPAASTRGSSVLAIAARYVGIPYRYGGTTPRGFDCSGFTGYVYRQLGVKLPRTANQQLGATKRISRSAARPGDLVFMTSGGRAYHVGIYAGKNMMYDSPRSGKTLQKRKIWTSAVVFGRVAR
jgi:cell wall-associated NlpC family hydrolase